MIAAPPVEVAGIAFQNPVLLAAGTAGFGRELADVIVLDGLGGIVTKSVSPEPRAGHPPPRVTEFPGGMLNNVGLANPGVDRVLAEELPWLAEHLAQARVLVSVVGDTVDGYVAVIERLGSHPVVAAFELNLSCPNTERGGEHFGAKDAVLADLVRRCRDASPRPLSAKLAPTLPDIGRTAAVAAEAGADAITVLNTLPGTVFADRGPTARLGAGQGGISGPVLLPAGVLATQRVRQTTGLPVIGVGGIRTPGDMDQYLAAGASLVAVGTAALADPRIPERLVAAWVRRG